MKIESKFGLHEKVYAVYKEVNDIFAHVFEDEIISITVIEDGTIDYLLDKMCETFKDYELVRIDDKDGLIKRIDEVLEVGKV